MTRWGVWEPLRIERYAGGSLARVDFSSSGVAVGGACFLVVSSLIFF